MSVKRWDADSIKRMEDGKWVEHMSGDPFASDPSKAWIQVVLASDYDALDEKCKAIAASDREGYRQMTHLWALLLEANRLIRAVKYGDPSWFAQRDKWISDSTIKNLGAET